MGNRKAFRLDLTLRHLLLLLFTVCECTKVSLTPRRKQLHWLSKTDEDVVSSPDVPTRIRGGSAQRRWERMDGKSYGGLTSSNGGEAGNSFQKSLQSVTVENEVGRACDFYVWDAPSALLHKWCHHLLKDCVYEGLGGRKFVRIEPGSILQLLYPCSRYSPDRCLVCGGTFRDHLTLWWANNLYTPFDNYMDRVYAKGVKLEPTFPLATTQTRKPSRPLRPKRSSYSRKKYNSPKRKTPAPVEMTKLFAFHRQYVVDVETIMDGTTDKEQRKKKLHKELKKARMKADSPLEIRMFTERRFFYVIPAVENTGSKKNKSEQQKPPSPALMLARAMVLNALDDMIGIQENENDRIRTKKQHDSCCN